MLDSNMMKDDGGNRQRDDAEYSHMALWLLRAPMFDNSQLISPPSAATTNP